MPPERAGARREGSGQLPWRSGMAELAGVEVRAFRGSRRSSLYRAHLIASAALALLLGAASERGLPRLAALRDHPARLEQAEARELLREAETLAAAVLDPSLRAELEALAALARWCVHSRGSAWMTIVSR